jgi:hypothetical protein
MPFSQQLRHWRDVLAGTIAVLTRSSARETSKRYGRYGKLARPSAMAP